MYIAFKWLIGFSLLMWATLCYLDFLLNIYKQSGHLFLESGNDSLLTPHRGFNKSYLVDSGIPNSHLAGPISKSSNVYCICVLLVALIAFNAVNNFKIRKVCLDLLRKIQYVYLEQYDKYQEYIPVVMKNVYNNIFLSLGHSEQDEKNTTLNVTANRENQIEDIQKEKRKLEQLLIIAMKEINVGQKSFEHQHNLQNSLIRQIHIAQNVLNDNKVQQINSPHFYWLISEENISLKQKLRTMCSVKDELEKKLISLIREVFRTNNSKLKYFCTLMILDAKGNVLNTSTAMQDILQSSRSRSALVESGDNFTENIKQNIMYLLGMKNPKNCSDGSVDQRKWFWSYSNSSSTNERECKDKNEKLIKWQENNYLVKYACSSSSLAVNTLSEVSLNFENGQPTSSQPICSAGPNLVTGSEAFRKFLLKTPMEETHRDPPTPLFLCG